MESPIPEKRLALFEAVRCSQTLLLSSQISHEQIQKIFDYQLKYVFILWKKRCERSSEQQTSKFVATSRPALFGLAQQILTSFSIVNVGMPRESICCSINFSQPTRRTWNSLAGPCGGKRECRVRSKPLIDCHFLRF